MKVRELVSKVAKDTLIKVVHGDKPVVVIESQYWDRIDSTVLDLEIRKLWPSRSRDGSGAPDRRLCVEVYTDRPTYVSSILELQNAVADKTIERIALTEDIDCGTTGLVKLHAGQKTIDLNGHGIFMTGDQEADPGTSVVFQACGGSTLNIIDTKGGGYVDGGETADSNICVAVIEESVVNIYGGHYTCGTIREDVTGSNTIYAQDGIINIYDGYFENHSWGDNPDKYLVLNIKDGSESYINCFGGIYADQNPADGDSETNVTSYVMGGYEVWTKEHEMNPGETLYQVIERSKW